MFSIILLSIQVDCLNDEDTRISQCTCTGILLFNYYCRLCTSGKLNGFTCENQSATCAYQMVDAATGNPAFDKDNNPAMSRLIINDHSIDYYVCPTAAPLLLQCAAKSLNFGIDKYFNTLKCGACPAGRTCFANSTVDPDAECAQNFVCPDNKTAPATHCASGYFKKPFKFTNVFQTCEPCVDSTLCPHGNTTTDPALITAAKCAKAFVYFKGNEAYCVDAAPIGSSPAIPSGEMTTEQTCALETNVVAMSGGKWYCHAKCAGTLKMYEQEANGLPKCLCPVGWFKNGNDCSIKSTDSITVVVVCTTSEVTVLKNVKNEMLLFCVTDTSAYTSQEPADKAPAPPMKHNLYCNTTSGIAIVTKRDAQYYCVKSCTGLGFAGFEMIGAKSAIPVCGCPIGSFVTGKTCASSGDQTNLVSCSKQFAYFHNGKILCLKSLTLTDETTSLTASAPISQIDAEKKMLEGQICDLSVAEMYIDGGVHYCVKSCVSPQVKIGTKDNIPVCRCPVATFGASCATSGTAADEVKCESNVISVGGFVACVNDVEMQSVESCPVSTGTILIDGPVSLCLSVDYCVGKEHIFCSNGLIRCTKGYEKYSDKDTKVVKCLQKCENNVPFDIGNPTCICGQGQLVVGEACIQCPTEAISCDGRKISKCLEGYLLPSGNEVTCTSCSGKDKTIFCDGNAEQQCPSQSPDVNTNRHVVSCQDGIPVCDDMYYLNTNRNINPQFCVQAASCGSASVIAIQNCYCSGYFIFSSDKLTKICMTCPEGAQCVDKTISCNKNDQFKFVDIGSGQVSCLSCPINGDCSSHELKCKQNYHLSYLHDECISCPHFGVCNNGDLICKDGFVADISKQQCICQSGTILDYQGKSCVTAVGSQDEIDNKPILQVYQVDGKILVKGQGFPTQKKYESVRALINFTTHKNGYFLSKTMAFDYDKDFSATVNGIEGSKEFGILSSLLSAVTKSDIINAVVTIKQYDDTLIGRFYPIIGQESPKNYISSIQLLQSEIIFQIVGGSFVNGISYTAKLISDLAIIDLQFTFGERDITFTESSAVNFTDFLLSVPYSNFYVHIVEVDEYLGLVKQMDLPEQMPKRNTANFVGIVIGVILLIALIIGIIVLAVWCCKNKKHNSAVVKTKDIVLMPKK